MSDTDTQEEVVETHDEGAVEEQPEAVTPEAGEHEEAAEAPEAEAAEGDAEPAEESHEA